MKLAFAGFRHSHVMTAYTWASQNPEIEIVGCFEENDECRESMKSQYPCLDFCYKTYEEMLNDESVDAVCISDYYAKRGSMVISALEHGKHVVGDKPLCTKLSELDRIEELVEKTGLQCFLLLDLRYMATTQTCRKLVASGAIGKVHVASFTGQHCLSYGSRPGWYFEEGKHGGTINDIAVHGVDLVRHITGAELTEVTAAKTWNAFCTQVPEFKDCGQFMAKMGDVALMADVSYAAPACNCILPTYWEFTFWGQDGMIRFNLAGKQVHLFRKTAEVMDCEPVKTDFMNDFVMAVQGKENPNAIIDTKTVLATARQTLTIQKAAE